MAKNNLLVFSNSDIAMPVVHWDLLHVIHLIICVLQLIHLQHTNTSKGTIARQERQTHAVIFQPKEPQGSVSIERSSHPSQAPKTCRRYFLTKAQWQRMHRQWERICR